MENTISRILIETTVRKALRDIHDSPERSIRNLVDMALHFSAGRFQQNFFQVAQTMLQNERSPYYALIKDTVAHVETERIFTLGMNLGYNSCTLGAKKIRETEQHTDCNIPWSIFLKLESQKLSKNYERYDSILSQGEALGIYTWIFFFKGQVIDVLSLAKKHPDSVFFLFCDAEGAMLAFHDFITDIKNVAFVIKGGKDRKFVCNMLHTLNFPCSIYDTYTDKNVDAIINGTYFSRAEKMHPIFSVLIAASDCSANTRKIVSDYVESVRKKQQFQTLAFELATDCTRIDSIISTDACMAYFDMYGNLHTKEGHKKELCFNILENDLLDIFQLTFPKKSNDIPSSL